MYPITAYGYAGVQNIYRTGAVPAVDAVPAARGAMSTKSVSGAEKPAQVDAAGGLPNGDVFVPASGVASASIAFSTEPAIDAFTAQRTWSA